MISDEHIDKHNPETFAGWLRMRADENRRVASLPVEKWPRNAHLLRHLAFRFDQGAELFDELRNEVAQLRKDLAIQAVNAKTVADLEAERDRLRHRMERIELLAACNVTGCGTCTSIIEEIAFLRSHGDVPGEHG